MREDWKKVKFSELFNNPKKAIISGPFGSNLKSAEYQSEGVPLVRLQNVDRWKFINKNIIYITSEKAKELSNHSYKSGDILISKLGAPLGKACIAPKSSGEGIVLADIVRVRVDENSHNKDFIVYQLNSEDISAQLRSLTTGATRPRVTLKNVRELSFVRPPLPEQKQIVAILDKAFAAIDTAKTNAEQNLQNTNELFESYLQNVFENKGDDWEEKELIEVTSKIGSGATPRGGKASYKEEGISLIRSMNVHDFEFKEKNLAFIDEQQANALSNVIIQEEDVLLNITGASIARCCIVPKEYMPARVNQHVSIIRAKKEIINPIFLASLLTSKFFKDQILEIGEQGATRQAITKVQLESFVISFPKDIREQKVVIENMNTFKGECKKLEAIYTQKIADLEEMKKSVLQKAFSGQLNTIN